MSDCISFIYKVNWLWFLCFSYGFCLIGSFCQELFCHLLYFFFSDICHLLYFFFSDIFFWLFVFIFPLFFIHCFLRLEVRPNFLVLKAAETAIQWSSYKEILWKFHKIPKKILLVECTFKLLLIILKLQVRGCFWSSCHTILFVKIIRSKLPMGCVLDRMMASKYRSSRPEVFCKKAVLKSFTKFIGKHQRQSLF